MKHEIRIKRVYEPPAKDDGYRVLVDRVWPRGLGKTEAHVDLWAKDIAPSTELRKWFGHDPERWQEFVRRYKEELHHPEVRDRIRDIVAAAEKHRTITLLYGAKDEQHNQAIVLQRVFESIR